MLPMSGNDRTKAGLAGLGLESMVYVRPITLRGRRMHVIHAADGTPLSIVPDRALAFAAASQYDMNAVSLH